MAELKTFPVFGEKGYVGTLLASSRFLDDRAEKTIKMKDGRELKVPSDSLTVQADGSFFLRQQPPSPPPPATTAQTPKADAAPPPPSPPVAANNTHIPKDSKPGLQLPIENLFRDGYNIERVSVDRLIDAPVSQRQEGDTLILPIVEEVLVYEKKLLLREEIRITRQRQVVEEIRVVDQKKPENSGTPNKPGSLQ